MTLFVFRNIRDKVIRGVVNCKQSMLFDQIDTQATPFDFEFAVLSPTKNNWFDELEYAEWFTFKTFMGRKIND